MLVHLIACWFFIYSFLIFSYLHDHQFLMNFLNQPKSWFDHPKSWHFDPSKLTIDLLWINLSKGVGLLAGFLTSLAIAIKKHWYWINSLIVFLVAILLLKFDIFSWQYLRRIFLAPGSLFKGYSIGYFLVNGSIMLAIGIMLFFLKRIENFIAPVVIDEHTATQSN